MPRKPSPYDGPWRRFRLGILARDGYVCRYPFDDGSYCGAPAVSVDHVIPLKEAPWLRLDERNCRAACTPHNQGRTLTRMSHMAQINRRAAPLRKW